MKKESLFGEVVISAKEMAQVERRSIDDGASDEAYMLRAGRDIASLAEDISSEPSISLLVGKGNNGGDAYVAGEELLSKGFFVQAFALYPKEECSKLNQKHMQRFQMLGGDVTYVENKKQLSFAKGWILDGLLGTGFAGKVEGLLYDVIEAANASGFPLLAIDIPSGLSGNDGRVGSIAIQAAATAYLGQPKIGFFLNEGFDHVGELFKVDFGLPEFYKNQMQPQAFLLNEKALQDLLPRPKRTQHKYEAGYVLGVGGSKGLFGAPLMSSFAAYKAGAGIVRLFHEKGIEEELSNGPLELVKEAISFLEIEPILREAKRAKACFVGPGIGRSEEAISLVRNLIEHVEIPVVCDADGLYALAAGAYTHKAPLILTPHKGEMLHLLGGKTFDDDINFHAACQKYAKEQNVTLLLKGAPSFVFAGEKEPFIIHHGDPGMATAGSGDVLTGIVAAFLASGINPLQAAALGAHVHALAGEKAAADEGSRSIIATDLVDYLGDVLKDTS